MRSEMILYKSCCRTKEFETTKEIKKKFLTNKKNCDKIIKLLAHKKRIAKKIFDN